MFANRVKETTTSNSSPFVISGTSPAGFQTFSTALAVNELACIEVCNSSQWMIFIGHKTDTNTIVVDTILGSSTNGAAVTFANGVKDILVTVDASFLKRMISISKSWNTLWDTAGYKILPSFQMVGPLALIRSDINSVEGGSTQAIIIADGVNVPTVDGIQLSSWTNIAGTIHLVILSRSGNYAGWSCGQLTAASLVQVPTAPIWSTNPVIAQAVVGSVTSVILGTVNGYPSPTITYQWKLNGVAIAGATTSSYTSVVGDLNKILTVTVTATNATGSDQVTSNGLTIGSITAPSIPIALTVGTATSTSQLLSWTAPTNNGGAAITGYAVGYRTPAGIGFYTFVNTGSITTSFTVTGLTASTSYEYVVQAINSVGNSTNSTSVIATTAALASYFKLAGPNGDLVIESGTGPYTYTHNSTATWNRADLATANFKFTVNSAATLSFKFADPPPINNGEMMVSLCSNSLTTATSIPSINQGTISALVFGVAQHIVNGTVDIFANATASTLAQVNVDNTHRYWRISRAANGNITCQSSSTGATWVERLSAAIATTPTNELWVKLSFTSPGGVGTTRAVTFINSTGLIAGP